MLKKILPVFVSLALVLAACAPSNTPAPGSTEAAPTTAPESTEPAVVHIGWASDVDTINPAYAFLATSYVIFDLAYSSLVKEGPDGSYVGDLAQSWERSDDGLKWTFTLKDNVKWHNGTPLTAADVAWSINEIKNDPEGWATLVNYTNGFIEATAPDDKTVEITLEYPISNMDYRVSFLYALWRADYEPLATTEALQNFTNDNLMGTGAFKVNTFNKEQGVVILDANKDFYDGAPKIDQVIFQRFDNDDAMVQAFRAGDIDMLYLVPSSAFETVKGLPNTKVVQTPSRSFDEIIVNVVPPERVETSTGHPALRDPEVRKALAHAINKQDLVDVTLQGLGRPGWSIIAPVLGGGFWHNPSITDYEYSPDKANQILDAAGYAKNAAGLREKDGRTLEFRLQFDADSAEYARNADLIADWLEAVGIKATPEAMDSDTLIANTTGVADFDLVIWGWGGDPDPDFILSIMLCDQFVVGGWSDSGYCNPDYDQWYLDQQQAVEPTDRQKIINQMQEALFRDLPYIVLYNYDSLQAYRSDRFTGFPDYIANPSLTVSLNSSFVLQQIEPVN